MKKALYIFFACCLFYLVGHGTIDPAGTGPHPVPHYSADNPWAPAPSVTGDCDVQDAPDARAYQMGQQLCGAVADAEAQAACLGDWQPPNPEPARAFCLEVQRHGCGEQGRDCMQIPADQVYFNHH